MNTFQQLQVLVLIALALLIAPAAIPPLRPHSRTMRLAALVIYLAGALAILAKWLIFSD
jgi:hypothetical protein